MQTAEALHAGGRASAPRTWPTTGSSTPRSGSRPSCTSTAACAWTRSSKPSLEGFRRGGARRAASTVRALLTAMRTSGPVAGDRRTGRRATAITGWSGFDIAGAEAGWPPSRHLDAFEYVQRENFHITIHAGEGFGLPSIWEAVQFCGAERLGHGVRIVDDIKTDAGRPRHDGRAGATGRVRPRPPDRAGDVPDLERPDRGGRVHRRAPDRTAPATCNFRVTVNTDNRLDERDHALL